MDRLLAQGGVGIFFQQGNELGKKGIAEFGIGQEWGGPQQIEEPGIVLGGFDPEGVQITTGGDKRSPGDLASEG